ncbi:DUF4222 domain-containing protein [Escherichia coli]
MKITFESYGLTASVVISSSIFESRKHQHIVDAVKLKAPEVTVTTHGLFRIRTTLTTTHLSACRVYDMALKEYNQCSSRSSAGSLSLMPTEICKVTLTQVIYRRLDGRTRATSIGAFNEEFERIEHNELHMIKAEIEKEKHIASLRKMRRTSIN